MSRSQSFGVSTDMDEPSHGGYRLSRLVERPYAGRLDPKVLLGTATPLPRRVPHPRRCVAFPLQALEGGVDRTERHVAAGPLRNLSPDRDSVGVLAKADQRKQDALLEWTQPIVTLHCSTPFLLQRRK